MSSAAGARTTAASPTTASATAKAAACDQAPPSIQRMCSPTDAASANIDEFKQLLLTDKDQLARNLAEKLLAYATGAEPAPLDRPQIDAIVKRVSVQGMGFRTLIHEIVQSALFQTK
jgi:predicted DNA binding CopG/RHH family protein